VPVDAIFRKVTELWGPLIAVDIRIGLPAF